MNESPKCPSCNGTGLVQSDAFGWVESFPCTTCGGSGIMNVVSEKGIAKLFDEMKGGRDER